MRILMLAQFYPPTIGGEERFVANLSRELAARGHDVSVATLWHKEFPEFEMSQGVHIHRVRGLMQHIHFLFSENDRQYSPPFPDPGVMSALNRIIREERPDIVHAHNWIAHSFTPLKAWSKARFVMSLHDYSHICVQKRLMSHNVRCSGPDLVKCAECSTAFYGPVKGILSVLANNFWGDFERRVVDIFLPVSQAVVDGNQLDKYKVPYQIISNFVPDHIDIVDDDDHPLLAQLPKGDFLLFVGDIALDKGAEVLLKAYAEMETRIPLVLIGRPFLINLDEQLPQNVFLMGSWPHNVVMGAWKRCTIGLVPSIVAETFGIVALEAMYMGKPLIAARSGGLADIVVEGETGLLVPPGDPQALRKAIESLLDNPDRRGQMGIRAKERIVEFQAKSVVSRFEQVYQELLEVDSLHSLPVIEVGNR